MGFADRSYAPRGFGVGGVPPGVKLLLLANIAVFVLFFFESRFGPGLMFRFFSLAPSRWIELWRPLTYLFLHDANDIWHILLNMLMLYMFGAPVEQIWGRDRFLRYYFLCGVGAGLCVLAAGLITGDMRPTIGASGAIFGLILAFGVLLKDAPVMFSFLFPIPAKYAAMIFGAIEFFALFGRGGSGVSHIAHLGGMVIGFFYIRSGLDKRAMRRSTSSRGLLVGIQDAYKRWKLERAKRKFEVYMRKNRER
ncbi:MAG: rhomboid family intramembrane serine protease [Bryobacteraceae bacterium]|nr:rhomboid family intramembrane serine protease [Bryobacteraceae bacterium]